MPEYIERAAAIKSLGLVAVGERAEDGAFNLAFAMAKERIYELPVVEIEPGKVREGGWITRESGMMTCSMCHTLYKDRMMPYYHFCPNCGAKMDGWRFGDG